MTRMEKKLDVYSFKILMTFLTSVLFSNSVQCTLCNTKYLTIMIVTPLFLPQLQCCLFSAIKYIKGMCAYCNSYQNDEFKFQSIAFTFIQMPLGK